MDTGRIMLDALQAYRKDPESFPLYYRAVGDGDHVLKYVVISEARIIILIGIIHYDEVPVGVEILAAATAT
jgi:hypothetical protein